MILSAIPAAPNGKAQLWYVDVAPDDVATYLPDSVIESAKAGLLERKELRCPSAQEMARIAYADTHAEQIARLFGVGGEVRCAAARSNDFFEQRVAVDHVQGLQHVRLG